MAQILSLAEAEEELQCFIIFPPEIMISAFISVYRGRGIVGLRWLRSC